jgi:hypothetical protein
MVENPVEANLQKQLNRLIVNVAQTEYEVVKKVARRVCEWKLKYF